jgi:VWFA-related protein
VIRLVALAVWLPVSLWCQGGSVFRDDVNLVVVPCSVTDAHGVAVAGLGAEDFRIYDNGAGQEVSYMALERDVPLTMGVIIDVSGSQRGYAQAHRDAVRKFLERAIGQQDRAFVAEVAESVILRSEATGGPYGLRDRALLRGEEPLGEPCPTLHGRSLCGGTALWEAVYAAASVKLQPVSGSKALVILSDGNDTGSIHKLGAAVEAAERADAVAYAIQYPDLVSGLTSEGLETLAAATGGIAFRSSEAGLEEILERIEADLRSRYILGFRPGSNDDQQGEHRLRVEAMRAGAVVHARTEYFRTGK